MKEKKVGFTSVNSSRFHLQRATFSTLHREQATAGAATLSSVAVFTSHPQFKVASSSAPAIRNQWRERGRGDREEPERNRPEAEKTGKKREKKGPRRKEKHSRTKGKSRGFAQPLVSSVIWPSPSTSPPTTTCPGKFPSLLVKIINRLRLHACVNHSRMRVTVASQVTG